MQLRSCLFLGTFTIGLALAGLPGGVCGQQPAATQPAAAALPDTPLAQSAASVAGEVSRSTVAAELAPASGRHSNLDDTSDVASQEAPGQAPAPAPAPAQTSSSDAAAAETVKKELAHETAEEQLKQQEHQRVAGVMATFNTTTNMAALPLSPNQKFRLFFKSATDPWPFLLSGITAGIGQANNSPPEWGQGLKGYARRFGGNYSDYFIGNFFGNAVLTSLLHEDPRFFQKGNGSAASRVGWAAASSFWCRRDNGKWGPNYANVGGNLIGAAIARSYYPESERNARDTITDGLTVTVEGIVGAEVIEFWPDIARHYKRKHAEKLARQEAQSNAKSAPSSGAARQ